MKLPSTHTTSELINQVTTIIHNTFNGTIKINEIKNIAPHIQVAQQIIVTNVNKKSEYAPDVSYLVKGLGLTVEQASKLLGISKSYAYKLLKK